jgi:tetratricopeptide (TPR) repeat protein
MSFETDRNRMRSSACALAALTFTALALFACGRGDSLEALKQRQEQGDFAATIEPLRNLLRDRPNDPEINYLYAHALVATQRPSLATWALRKAMEDPNYTVRAGLELIQASLAAADYNEAVAAAQRVLEVDPDNLEALVGRANAQAYWRKDPESALTDVKRILELDPDSIDALKPKILALLALQRSGDARDAIAELGRRLEEVDAPETTRSWYCVTRAIFTEEDGDLAGARKQWPECLKQYPAIPDVVFSATTFYDNHGEPERSLEVLRAAVAADGSNAAFRSRLADVLRASGATDEGEALLKEATNTEDVASAATAWFELGRFRRNASNYPGAAEAMKRAYDLAKDPGPVPPQLGLEYAEVLFLEKQFDEALKIADQLTVPAHQHLIRARTEQERGNAKAALDEFTEAFRLWPDNPQARYYAGRAAETAGDFDRALEEYRTSIRIDAGATDVRTRAAALLAAEGKPRLASQMLRQPHEHPLDETGLLLSVYLTGRHGTADQVEELRKGLDTSDLSIYAGRIAELARGVGEGSGGPAAGLRVLRKSRQVDFADPHFAPALRRLVQLSHASGAKGSPAELAPAVARHADSAAFQEIRGFDLELAGDLAAARAAYERAIALESGNARALAGMGRVLRESEPDRAVEFFDRAAAADPTDPEPGRLAAKALAAAGKTDDAAKRLEALLAQHPLDAEAAALRAQLDLDRGVASAATLDWARRAARLGGGADALDLLSRIHTQRGETDEASRVAERAKALREEKSPRG